MVTSLNFIRAPRASHLARWLSCGAVFLYGSVAAQVGDLKADLGLGEVASPSAPDAKTQSRARALAHYGSALQAESAGRLREAMRHYLDAVQADPTHPELAARAADMALNYEGREQALQLLEASVKASPEAPAAYLNLARFLSTYESEDAFEKDRAVSVLKSAVAKFPREAEVYRALVTAYLVRSERSLAEDVLTRALKQPNQQPDFWLVTGRAAQEVWPLAHPQKRAAHRTRVNPFFENALRHAPVQSRQDVHLEVAQYFLLSSQVERAGQIISVLHQQTANTDAARLLVRIYQAQSKTAQALNLLEQLIEIEPDDVEHRRLAAGLYEQEEDFSAAVPHMEAIIRLAGGAVEDYLELANVLLRSGQLEKALQLTQRTRVLFPNNPRFVLVSAIAARALRRPEEAEAFYAKAEALAQAVEPALITDHFYQTWADLLQGLKRYDDAAKKYQKAIALTPPSDPKRAAVVLNNLGYMWLEIDRNIDKAGEFIRRACELDPDSAIYLDSLGWYHFKKGEFDEALRILLRVESMLKDPAELDPEILDHIARTYQELGQKDKALQYYERAVRMDGASPEVRRRLDALKEKP
jgi:tetratricopeptide (TPR) repeat protein